MDILGLIAVLSFDLTCFGIGYSVGKDITTIVATHKNNRSIPQKLAVIFE